MQFETDRSLEAFRDEVRSFIQEHLPADIRHRVQRAPQVHIEQDALTWRRILHEKKGWSVAHWPVEYGGTGWSPHQLFIFDEEAHRAHAPQFPWQNTHLVGPVIYTFGSAEQKARFLPPIVRGDYHWAQGFSEPGSGSDLASLRTRADRDGDHYVVNGQKVWTSGAHHAEWIFCLVKTDTSVIPQKGISFLMIPANAPGLVIRPIMQMDHQEHLCEVFFDNVRVPCENLVGEAGAGWKYAKFLLDNERTESSFIYWTKRELEHVKHVASQELRNGVRLFDDPVFRSRFVHLEAEVQALEWSVLRVLAEEKTPYHATAVASCLKVRGSQLQQQVTEMLVEGLGERGLRRFYTEESWDMRAEEGWWPEHVPGAMNTFLWTRSSTLQGGTRQVQLNIIAKLAFGL